jgi:hypothetical protein
MIDTLYGRKIELMVGQKQFVNELGKDGLTINFDVPFDDDKEPNVATIQIFNLSDQTIHGIKKGAPVILNAGYQNDAGSIFLGFVEKPTTQWQGVDKVTEIKAVDGSESWLRTTIKRTYKAGISGKAIISDLLGMTGLEIGSFNLPTDRLYRGGKTINTTLSKAIAEVAKDCGAKTHVTRGKIFIRPKNEGQTIGFVIDREHGLIASPTPIEKEAGEGKNKKTVSGWKVVSLLNHRISTDAIVEIKSKTANGTFRVEKGRHYGDGRAFYTEMEVYPV